jgi:hypothetical protein
MTKSIKNNTATKKQGRPVNPNSERQARLAATSGIASTRCRN